MIYGLQYSLVLGHKYYRNEWSKEINELKFGKCTQPHGHNYKISMAIESFSLNDSSVRDSLFQLDLEIQKIFSQWDHQFIDSNHIDFLGMIPTTEVLTKVIAQKTEPLLPKNLKLKRVLVYEGADISAEGHY